MPSLRRGTEKGICVDSRTQLDARMKEMEPGELDDDAFFERTLATSRIRALKLQQVFPGIERVPVVIGAIDPDTKHANHVDMLYVCAMARHRRARRIFEFGTYLGRTTYHLALGPDVEEVLTLDLDPAGPYPHGLK